MRKARLLTVGLLLAGLLAGACGGKATPAPTPKATPTPTPTPALTPKVTPTPTPTPALTPKATPTPTPPPPPPAGSAEAGKAVFQKAGSGCIACHTVAGVSTSPVGPELTKIGTVAATRKPGMSAEAYIRESELQPNTFVVPGFQPIMPPAPVSGKELDDLIAYLLSLK